MSETFEVKTNGTESYIEVDNRRFLLDNDPDNDTSMTGNIYGRETELRQFLSAILTDKFNPVLKGDSGTGKTFFVQNVARMCGKRCYTQTGQIEQMEESLRYSILPPDDKSPYFRILLRKLAVAMLTGQWYFIDEIDKLPQSTLDILIPVCDSRRTLELPGLKFSIKAHPEFRFMCSSNNDIDTSVQDHIRTRLRPVIKFRSHSIKTLNEIIKHEFVNSEINLDRSLTYFWTLWNSKSKDQMPNPRDIIQVFSYAMGLARHDLMFANHPISEINLYSSSSTSNPSSLSENNIYQAFNTIFTNDNN